MKIFEGHSFETDAAAAVSEATEGWGIDDPASLNMIFAFCSTKQNAAEISQELARCFPGVPLAGCTTSGEHLSGQHFNGAFVLTAIRSPHVRWAATMIDDLAEFDTADGMAVADRLYEELDSPRADSDPDKNFCLLFIDGLSMQEERVTPLLADCIEGSPLMGGSAGDDLNFSKTEVFCGQQCSNNAAVLVMGRAERSFEIIKHQHFTTTPSSLAITKADAAARRVIEIDGIPAIDAYARALGLRRDDITGEVTFLNPVTFLCNDELYVRSIQKIEDDGSIVFYCGIEEGMVLDIGGHHEMVSALSDDLQRLSDAGGADFLLGCNCILRALEADGKKKHSEIGDVWSKVSDHSIGFDTYGEQLNGIHINQTLVALAFTKQAA